MRATAVLILAVLALPLIAPPAAAQTFASPITGDYDEVYVIMGRAVDAGGRPVAGGKVSVELQQAGVRAEPLIATANCKGDFITSFPLRTILPSGKATIRIIDDDGQDVGHTSVSFDPFFRRSDAIVRMDGFYPATCTEGENVWDKSVTVAARILNRTEEYVEENVTYHARPYTGIVRLRYQEENGRTTCPPHPSGAPDACEFFGVDERGDMRYSFVFAEAIPSAGNLTVLLQDNTEYRIAISDDTRLAVFHIEATGQGVPTPVRETPALAPLVLFALAAALALLRRHKA